MLQQFRLEVLQFFLDIDHEILGGEGEEDELYLLASIFSEGEDIGFGAEEVVIEGGERGQHFAD